MIYFDNAATTLVKPPEVKKAVMRAMDELGNPGRSGHPPSLKSAEVIYGCRERVCELFGFDRPEGVVFTPGASSALDIAVRRCLKRGQRALISGYEHNSAVRPLEELDCRIETVSFPAFAPCLKAFEDAVEKERPDCVIVSHVSNVFGFELPVGSIASMCRAHGIPLIIDASQSAGNVPVDVKSLKGASYICAAGHKSLFGPPGTGILICLEDGEDEALPDALETGTPNFWGIAGLSAGIEYVIRHGIDPGGGKKRLLSYVRDGLSLIPGVSVFSGPGQNGVLSFSCKMPSEVFCSELSARGICVRGGLHCAPLAHRTAGTFPDGTVRLSFSRFNSLKEGGLFLKTVEKLLYNC